MSAARGLLGLAGVAAGLWGAWLLLGPDRGDTAALVSTVVWLGGGVLLHDVVLAPLVLLLGFVAVRLLPGGWRAAVAGGLVVLGSVTLLAIPVLGRFGAKPDNPTLLDRAYGPGWLAMAAGVVLGTLVVGLLRRRRAGLERRGVSRG